MQANSEVIRVNNAGIVLLSDYIPILFDRLKFLDKNGFINPEIQADAVHYLQYIVTGLTQTAEELLPLNKVLCGLPVSTPVKTGINISAEEEMLMDSLIEAAISHWLAIGQTSVNNFRGNWLVRDGMLSEHDDSWQLIVDKRAYDVLISKSPFSFSVIKFPWMEKPLHVSWPY